MSMSAKRAQRGKTERSAKRTKAAGSAKSAAKPVRKAAKKTKVEAKTVRQEARTTTKPTKTTKTSIAKRPALKESPVRAIKKAEPKKAEMKKAEAKKAEPKKVEPKKAEPKKLEPKKAEPKKLEVKKAERVETAAPPPPAETKEKKMVEIAKPVAQAPAKKAVVRIARGLRTPKHPPKDAATAAKETSARDRRSDRPEVRTRGPEQSSGRPGAPKIEVNPRLESSKHLVKNQPRPEGEKPMSVAAKHRAAAEAMFARLTVEGRPSDPAPAPQSNGAPEPPAAAPAPPPPPPAPLPYAARRQEEGGGSFTMRVSERDTLTTALRLSQGRDEALRAATELADRYQLPPDQGLLLKVVQLGDSRLTKLALEELLELEDRGRVRATPELSRTLRALATQDPETVELRQLLLEKIGAAG
jgi:hypothetical protein